MPCKTFLKKLDYDKYMKLKTVITVVCVLVVTTAVLFVPAGLNVSDCINQATARTIASTEYIKTLPTVEEKKKRLCQDDIRDFTELNLCLSKNRLSPVFIKVLPKARNTIQQVINGHNRLCPNDPVPNTII